MASKVTNNAATTIAGSINSVVTTINLAAGTGALFPTLSGSDWFYGTLIDASNNLEVVKVTARATDALTVTRGQDGTTARSYTVGDRFELRPTAALFNDKADIDSPSFTTKITTPAITLGSTALTATGAELNYVTGVTSAIQTQINAKAPTASPTFTGTATIPTLTLTNPLAIAQGGTGATTAASAFAAIKQAATTAATGVVELSTSSESVGYSASPSSTVVCTPSTLASDRTLSTSGHQYCAGGLLLQWGRSSNLGDPSAGAKTLDVSFEEPFPNAVLGVFPSIASGGNYNGVVVNWDFSGSTLSAARFRYAEYTGEVQANTYIQYWAIGY